MREANVCDVIIKDLQGNYYDINCLKTDGNDSILLEIKLKDEEYRECRKEWKSPSDYLSKIKESG